MVLAVAANVYSKNQCANPFTETLAVAGTLEPLKYGSLRIAK